MKTPHLHLHKIKLHFHNLWHSVAGLVRGSKGCNCGPQGARQNLGGPGQNLQRAELVLPCRTPQGPLNGGFLSLKSVAIHATIKQAGS